MKKRIILTALVMFTGCSLYVLQTPDTVPKNKTSFGIGLVGNPESEVAFLIPGFWARTGITKNMDIGIHSFGVGIASDIKYKIIPGFALGAGAGFAVLGFSAYYLNGSGYFSIPLKPIEPYGVLRLTAGGVSYEGEGASGLSTEAVGGIRLNLNNRASILIDGGVTISNSNSSVIGKVIEFGISIGH